MTRRLYPPLVLVLALLALAACGDDPTQPGRAPVYAVASNRWITRADMPTERFRLAAAVVPNAAGQSVLYAIGGVSPTLSLLGKVQAYNAATNAWSTKASLPRVLNFTNGTGVIGGKIYLSGGEGSAAQGYSARLFVYDPATNAWAQKHDMPHPTYGGVTGVINGKLYVLTTCSNEDRCPVPLPVAFYRYDPAADHWAVLPAPAHEHEVGMGGVIGGKLYVTGGYFDGNRENLQLDVYDPARNVWTRRATLPRARAKGAGVVLGGKLYVVGGSRISADQLSTEPVRTVDAYDASTNTWTTKASIPSDRDAIAGGRVFVNGQPRIEIVGGTRPGNNLQYTP